MIHDGYEEKFTWLTVGFMGNRTKVTGGSKSTYNILKLGGPTLY